MIPSKRLLSLPIAISLAASAFSAEAEDEENLGEIVELDPITVKGELQERLYQDTISSVAIVDPKVNERALQDTLNRIANVGLDGFDDRFTIRGIAYDGVGFAGQAQTISIDIDGVPVDNWAVRTGWNSMWDMEQVEVLRGPQSTNQGRNALAGAVVMNSVRPKFYKEGKARLLIESDDTYGAAAAQNLSLVDNTLAFRFAAERETSEGFIFNPTTNEADYGGYDRIILRGSFLWRPTQSEDFEILTILRFADSDVGENSVNNDDNPFDFENTSGYANASANANETFSASVQIDRRLNDSWSLSSISTFNKTDYFTRTGFDTVPQNTSERSRDAKVDSYTQDIHLTFGGDRAKGVIGIFGSYFDEYEEFGGTLPAAFLELPPPYETFSIQAKAPNEETNYALYTEWDYELDEQWELIAGFRYDHEERDRVSESDTVLGPEDPFGIGEDGDPVAASTEFDVFLPKVGIKFSPTDNVTYGFMYQQGYRSGGTDINIIGEGTFEFDPEFTQNLEFSFRSQWLGQRLRFDANLFHTDWKDQQVSVLIFRDDDNDGENDNTTLTRTANAGSSELYGAEIEIGGYLNEARTLEIYASLGLLDTEIKEFVDSDGTDFGGNSFPLATNLNFGAGIRYNDDSGFFAAADFSYNDGYESAIENNPVHIVGSFTELNIRFGYEARSWAVTAYANNLFDEETALFKNPITITPAEPFKAGLITEFRW